MIDIGLLIAQKGSPDYNFDFVTWIFLINAPSLWLEAGTKNYLILVLLLAGLAVCVPLPTLIAALVAVMF